MIKAVDICLASSITPSLCYVWVCVLCSVKVPRSLSLSPSLPLSLPLSRSLSLSLSPSLPSLS